MSTRNTVRPGLAAALDYLRPGDTLVVWKLDRLGRSVKDVLTIADGLHKRGVQVQILTGKLAGLYSPVGEGKFFFTMMAAFAELERDILLERTMAGLAAARGHGRAGGRPTVMDADKLAAVQARRINGESYLDRQGTRRVPGQHLPPPRPDRLRMTNAVAGPQPGGIRNARYTKAAMHQFGTGDGPSGWELICRRAAFSRCAWDA